MGRLLGRVAERSIDADRLIWRDEDHPWPAKVNFPFVAS